MPGGGAVELFIKGGPVMWPLLALSVLGVALAVERALFWLRTHRPGRRRWVQRAAKHLRHGRSEAARELAAADRTVYGKILGLLADADTRPPSGVELIETYRGPIERFGSTFSTIITAAPLLGILGTVLGIIESFDLLGAAEGVTDISGVAAGIAQALITTAFGLGVALLALFPYMVFRAQAERCVGAIEMMAAAAQARS